MKDQLSNCCRDSFLKDALNAFIWHYLSKKHFCTISQKNTSALSLKKITLARLVAAFISSHLSGVLLKVRCKSSSEVGGLRVAKKVDVSDYQKWAACVLLKKSM